MECKYFLIRNAKQHSASNYVSILLWYGARAVHLQYVNTI